jgi:uncharacterized membrane protein HdeD (DUF308 family)
MRDKRKRNILTVATIVLLVAGIIAGSIVTDRNFAPGSMWPHAWGAIGVISAFVLVASWAAWWNKKQ